MTHSWQKDDLGRIADADDLHIAPLREDGATHGTPTWIWSVAVDDGLYVRAYNGQKSSWFKAAMRQGAGRIVAAGMTKDVVFEAADGDLSGRIDDAYRVKYASSSYLGSMISERARGATVRVMPREATADRGERSTS